MAKTPAIPAEIETLPDLTADNWLDGLDERERKFVLRYCATLDVRNSAIYAGYEETTATVKAYGWVSRSSSTKPHVRRAVDFDLKRRADEQVVTADMVVRRLKAIAFADPRKIADWRAHIVRDQDELEPEEGQRGDRIILREVVSNTITLKSSDEIDDDTAAAIKEIKQNADGSVTIRLHDARAALADLGKHLGIMDDRLRITGGDGGPVKLITGEMPAKAAADAYRDMLAEDE
jgi:hypothetical protein